MVKDHEIFTRRNGWPLARVEEVFPSEDGLVRKVRLRVANKQADKTISLTRPISKLVFLVEAADTATTPTTTPTTTITTTTPSVTFAM